MQDSDIARIIKMHISPINISIHTTNPELRVRMMKNKRSGEVLRYLGDFRDAGLNMCGQIVLCRGVNDGEELRRTLTDLKGYFPALTSVAIVPAGLTEHRDGLYPLTDFTPEEAEEVIRMIDSFGEECLAEFGTRLFFAADEFYIKAGLIVPTADYYEDYPQIENGVGMLRSYADEFESALDDIPFIEEEIDGVRYVSAVTGEAAFPMIQEFADYLMHRSQKIRVKVIKIENNFFGRSITVAGLMTGKDIAEQLEGIELGDELLIPANALRHGEDVFLCGMTVGELSEKLATPIRIVDPDGYSFVEAVFGQGI
jgi:putative radical SAM enzyme (TIGR03279 family)